MLQKKKGAFITFEGGEGAGKSTLIDIIRKDLQRLHIEALVTREPGGTKGAEEIRKLLVQGATDKWDCLSEVFLLSAGRRDHLIKYIWPALEKGQWVLCDRFFDSTRVYQGYAREGSSSINLSIIEEIGRLTFGDFKPDLTFILDILPEIGLKRAGTKISLQKTGSKEDRYETLPIDFHHKVRESFLKIAKNEPERCHIIDASLEQEIIHKQVIEHIVSFFALG